MGLSSSKTKTKTSELVAPNPTYAPQINAAADAQGTAYNAAQQNVTNNVMPAINQGMGYYGDVLSGKYLNSNPYLDSVIGDTNRGITNEVNSNFEGAGRYGSGAHTGVLADRIAANENALRYGNYNAERANQGTAAQGIGPLGALSAGLPQAASSQYGQAISQLLGRYVQSNGTSVTKSSRALIDQWLEAASAAAQAAASGSDVRLKENIRQIGTLEDGLKVYSYTYRQDMEFPLPAGPQVGVMAQEVAEKRPWALGPKIGDYGTVVYGRL